MLNKNEKVQINKVFTNLPCIIMNLLHLGELKRQIIARTKL